VEPDWEPVQGLQCWSDVLISPDTSQDPSSRILHTLQFVECGLRNPSKKCIAVVNAGKNKTILTSLSVIGKDSMFFLRTLLSVLLLLQ